MNNEMTKCLTSLFDALNAKSEEEAMKMFGDAINHAKESKVDINNPEYFDCFINHKLKKGIKLLASILHKPSVCKDKNKPNFIYANYSFLENHIRNLCELREGSACCADKSRYILKMYLKYSIDDEVPAFNPNVENYWIPNFGDNEMWIKYCDSLCRLYYGYTEEYFKAYNSLIQCDIRKFKHILHKWYMEFNDGEMVEFDHSWDDRSENPLEGCADKGDFYIMHKGKIKNKHFDVYVTKDEEKKMLYRNYYVKIPKSEIKQIYKESEERMV
ncbi:hypothetical protein FDC45_15970 [Clostridium botulinum]|uniref:Uncharacterized protein n=1 Tax=Clostridium botulinum TaxID=1491 RepID=A0A846J7V2_CLOBO|nr:hypothetical protein [Clostridium botulinum]ACA57495.1 hypothetical protein CLK_A0205 [Clostridium botulinum A3 str. Loch Maree]NFH64975.1 hypothetical protein [Clostridium botulinum]NFJ09572.1 hypothetical protein [Clostridium botulinum]NFK16541.1 hypothetical protein [Clostridium botulinum]NFM93506.1 hypothetical protein [Clostridium botulinum]